MLPDRRCDYGLRVEGDVSLQAGAHGSSPYALLLTMTSRRDKLWPEERWRALVAWLEGQGVHCVLPWGTDEERRRCARIATAIPGAVVPQRMPLTDLARLARGARCVIGVDTGLTHLAAALDVPAVGSVLRIEPRVDRPARQRSRSKPRSRGAPARSGRSAGCVHWPGGAALMSRALYTLTLFLLAPLVLARLWWRGIREPGYRRHLGERFGYYRTDRGARPLLWVHAVSVGEARASAALVKALAADYPGHDLLLTCMTAAGRETLAELHGDSVIIAWLPYD